VERVDGHDPPVGEPDCQVSHLEHHRLTTRLGSSISRMPSPIRLNAMAVSRIARPGKVTNHHWVAKYWAPWLTIRPHSGVGSCAPSPRNEIDAAVSRMPPASIDICTSTGVIELGRTWRSRMRACDTPSTRQLSM